MDEGLLSGLRVVEVSSWLAGPVAALLLAEAGAEVVKVEPPGGDPARPLPGFATWNRSKQSVVLDLHTEEGRASLHTLLAGADVLVHSFPPSAAARAGLDDARLGHEHPALIRCGILGWPHGHPDEDRDGFDILAQAATGVMDEELGTRPGPVFLRFPYASWNAGFLAVVGILARLRERDLTGLGGPVRTSLMEGATAPMSKHWALAERPTPTMAYAPLAKGQNSAQACSDGLSIVVGPGDVSLQDVPLFAEALAELPADVAADPFSSTSAALGRRTRDEWLAAMWAAGMATVPVATQLGESLSDEQVRAAGYAVEVLDPLWGPTIQAAPPVHVTPPMAVLSPAPRLGQHTDEVLGAAHWPARPAPVASLPGARPSRPLEGVKVLDFGMFLAGPYGPQLMADLGADVVKVEATTGDRLRSAERIFAGCQRGKRSVAVDLRSPASRPVLESLVRWADVVHHNLRLPPARLLGLDYESIRAIDPSVVYCHVSSYGPTGPRRDWPGVDPTSQAVVGWMQEAAGPGNPPRWNRIGMTDDQCAMCSVVAVLLALGHRDRTGEGSDVRASILGAANLTTSETMLLEDGSIAPYPLMDQNQTGLTAGYRIYECADGWIAVAAVTDEAMSALRATLGAGDDADLEAAFAARLVADVSASLTMADVQNEPVRMANEQAFLESELHHRLGMVVTYQHPIYGRVDQLGSPVSFGGPGPSVDRPVPVLGQHTTEVLSEIGITGAEIAELARAGLILDAGLADHRAGA
ncbi:MAG TPA: CoA transferase [Acidimicrobiales bacterium]